MHEIMSRSRDLSENESGQVAVLFIVRSHVFLAEHLPRSIAACEFLEGCSLYEAKFFWRSTCYVRLLHVSF